MDNIDYFHKESVVQEEEQEWGNIDVGGMTTDELVIALKKADKTAFWKAYNLTLTPEARAANKARAIAYRETPEARAAAKAYQRARTQDLHKTPEALAAEKAYQKAYALTPEAKAAAKARHLTPEAKAIASAKAKARYAKKKAQNEQT